MNGGKVYYTLINTLNNNLIKIIQRYNIKYNITNYLKELKQKTSLILLNNNVKRITNYKYSYASKCKYNYYWYVSYYPLNN